MDTRSLARARVARDRPASGPSAPVVVFVMCVVVPLLIVYLRAEPVAQRPVAVVESVKALRPLDDGRPSQVTGVPAATAAERHGGEANPQPEPTKPTGPVAPHESDAAMAVLNRERARAGGSAFAHAFHVYRPRPAERPGGDLDDQSTLANAVAASAADGEIMILCIGGSGSMRAGMNLVFNFRQMGLYHMLILAPQRAVCEDLWGALPTLACVWWPSVFTKPRPPSLYNTMFSRTALAFFEARKLLLEQLVRRHKLNVLHLDADTVWFANPYPIFKSVYKAHSLIVQTDNPFVNAGILYVQNAHDGDAATWVLQELNRRIDRFTYRPESVRELPHSAWSTAPHFANADEQANLNDIVTTSLTGKPTFSAGVEFYEARFKRDRGDAHAKRLMSDGGWQHKMLQAEVRVARSHLSSLRPERSFEPLVHLCKPSLYGQVQAAELRVPDAPAAARSSLLLAPEWLFSHFPYGAFFPSFRDCHADSWGYAQRTALEQRLCMPAFRVPVVMVHMAGLRNGQWGRRGVMRALGVWNDAADAVATHDWVSARTDRLLVVDGPFAHRFRSMAEFDRFAARLLLLASLLGRRAVMPSMPCAARWAQSAMEPRHLRGLEVGCSQHKQCVWLPMPHFKEAWCSGVDFLYSIDYEGMVDKGEIAPHRDVVQLQPAELRLAAAGGAPGGAPGGAVRFERVPRADGAAAEPLPAARVLRLSASALGDPLEWLSLDGFQDKSWRGSWPTRVAAALQDRQSGLGLDRPQMQIMKDCMHSLATSRD